MIDLWDFRALYWRKFAHSYFDDRVNLTFDATLQSKFEESAEEAGSGRRGSFCFNLIDAVVDDIIAN